ncbi:hypothetical protein AJ88_48500 [Mesorhizobium amorphae CCBAU 01583]|nr:hypothetical protein AJ88_48500 [Mesorhizobium amorphae CCBAU 01583]
MSGTWMTTRAWLLMLPLLVVMVAVIGWPLVDTVGLSFTDAKLVGTAGNFVGIDNYTKMLSSSNFSRTLVTTTWFAVASVAIEMVIGVLAALLLNQEFRGRTFLRALMILPWALPTVVNATLWRLIYNPEYGALNAALTQLHLIDAYRSWLGEPGTALAALIIADCWKNFPLVALIALAALQAVPRDITAASLVDGAGPFARFRFVILPYLAGPLMVALVLRTIEAFKVFDIIWVMTRGGPANSTRTLSILVYQEAFSFQRAGSGASLALIVTLLVTVLALAYAALVKRPPGAPPDGTQEPRLQRLHLCLRCPAWRRDPGPIAWLFVMSISPAADLAAKPLRWWPQAADFSRYQQLLSTAENSAGAAFTASLRNSLEIASMATLAALLLAIPAGWAVSRTPSIGWSLSMVIATYMLPPVALAVPLYMGLSYLGLLNNVFGLAMVYLTILAPFTTWLMKSGFDAIPREIEAAAMIDGAGLFQTLRIITLPLAAPVVATSALFAVLLAWDEFFYALLFTSDQRAKTLTVAIADLAGGRVSDYGLIATAGVLAALPPVLIGLVMQRALISGLTSGGVKG